MWEDLTPTLLTGFGFDQIVDEMFGGDVDFILDLFFGPN